MREFTKIKITPKGERAARHGHPWVFCDEITNVDGTYQNGDLVDVYSSKDKYLGTGFINDNSKIHVRIISTNANDKFDEAFWQRRVQYALDYRRQVMGEDFNSCRLIFGEADNFPGLTVDRFEDVLVAQVLSLGIEQRKDIIFTKIIEIMRSYGEEINCLYERNDVKIRKLEGMEEYKGFYKSPLFDESKEHTTLVITENGIKYNVDVENGQKTGFFLDQKYNRRAVSHIAKGRNVLDCFTHTGAFALNAAMGGAKSVIAVDISQEAVDMTTKNIEMNGLTNVKAIKADVFNLLTKLIEEKNKDYDFIILDPPAFTKSHATVTNAYRGYKDINLRAMKLLPRGGYLATCSCSHFMKEDLFLKMLHEAASDAKITLRQIEARQQSPDHPIVFGIPETYYLKFYLFQIV
ncbi:class I SAM-dependent rRNA methyltransferase [Megamonas hypermegale]|uniref:class I SAM-dependent rRNA methyltransferase n=1 Tax=Megamonas hypermegale TaxID=158847 RepID=UPI00195AB773|nr:class I SAM-dependent rRNA methyltransferase [Megamonas hypermegale]MBM6833167.1 class I SAM-dependent rRNA methyltransferase [Megamonas hypermegale]